jgi:hypothetical protein
VEIGEEEDLTITVGARGIGGDLQGVLWCMVGVVEKYWPSSLTLSLV